jgi:hypothetical protein
MNMLETRVHLLEQELIEQKRQTSILIGNQKAVIMTLDAIAVKIREGK